MIIHRTYHMFHDNYTNDENVFSILKRSMGGSLNDLYKKGTEKRETKRNEAIEYIENTFLNTNKSKNIEIKHKRSVSLNIQRRKKEDGIEKLLDDALYIDKQVKTELQRSKEQNAMFIEEYEKMALFELCKKYESMEYIDEHDCKHNNSNCLISFEKGESFKLEEFRESYIASGDIFVCKVNKKIHTCKQNECDALESNGSMVVCGLTGRTYQKIESQYNTMNPRSKLEYSSYGMAEIISSNKNKDEAYIQKPDPIYLGENQRCSSAPAEIMDIGIKHRTKRVKKSTRLLKQKSIARSIRNTNTKLLEVISCGDNVCNSELYIKIIHCNTEKDLIIRNFHNELEFLLLDKSIHRKDSQSTESLPRCNSSPNGGFYEQKSFMLMNEYKTQNMSYSMPITILNCKDREFIDSSLELFDLEENSTVSDFCASLSDISKNVQLNTIYIPIEEKMNNRIYESYYNKISNDITNIIYPDRNIKLSQSTGSLLKKRESKRREVILKAFEKTPTRKLNDCNYIEIFHLFFKEFNISHEFLYDFEDWKIDSFLLNIYKFKLLLLNRYHIQLIHCFNNNTVYLIKDLFLLFQHGLSKLYYNYEKSIMKKEQQQEIGMKSIDFQPESMEEIVNMQKVSNLLHQKATNIIFHYIYLSKIHVEKKQKEDIIQKKHVHSLKKYIHTCNKKKIGYTLFEAWVEFSRPIFEEKNKKLKIKKTDYSDILLNNNDLIERYANIVIESWKRIVISPTVLIRHSHSANLNSIFEKHCIAIMYKIGQGFFYSVQLDKSKLLQITQLEDERLIEECFPDFLINFDLQLIPKDEEFGKCFVHLTDLGNSKQSLFHIDKETGILSPLVVSTESFKRWKENQNIENSVLFNASNDDLKDLPTLRKQFNKLKSGKNVDKALKMKKFKINGKEDNLLRNGKKTKYKSTTKRNAKKYSRTLEQLMRKSYITEINFNIDLLYKTLDVFCQKCFEIENTLEKNELKDFTHYKCYQIQFIMKSFVYSLRRLEITL